MSEVLTSFYNLWILTNICKVKGTYFLSNLLNGTTRDVNRIDESFNQNGIVTNIYNHISNLVSDPSHIIDNIYLGSAYNVGNLDTLQQLEIERVLNVTKEIPCSYPDIFTYKTILVKDTRDSFLSNYLDDAYHFLIDNPSQPVMVHCYMGSSRSATIVIYYLMKKYKMPYNEALDYVKTKRNCVNLNKNFAEELQNIKFLD